MNLEKIHNSLNEEYAVTLETLESYSQKEGRLFYQTKRAFDVLIAFFGLICLFPILILFCIAIKFESKGPIFYLQDRVGLNGEYFKIIKLRSMRIDAEEKGPQWAVVDDPRVTNVGLFIRRTRIDEIPQLINVLKGEMSIVGPRPERPMFTMQFNDENPEFINRLTVKPGITGWAQINGGYDLSPNEKLELDLYYIENKTIILDLFIILKTFAIVLSGNGAR